jgi:antirestriction protein
MEKENTISTDTINAKQESYTGIVLHAQPYDISAHGFFFNSLEVYEAKSSILTNNYGQPVEEFEIQFIDGDEIDCDLFKALDIHQGNFDAYLKACEEWDKHQKINAIIAVGEGGYKFDIHNDSPDDFDITLYEEESLLKLAYAFVEEGLFGKIPENLQSYIDYEAIARDLSMDYSETTIAGTKYIYRMG